MLAEEFWESTQVKVEIHTSSVIMLAGEIWEGKSIHFQAAMVKKHHFKISGDNLS